MRFKRLAAVLTLAFTSPMSFAEDFYIEAKDLTVLPKSAEAAIRSSKGFESNNCKIIGKAIALSSLRESSGYIATTADSCDWGAAVGPIWIIKNESTPVSVLEYAGYSVTLALQTHHGLHDLVISAATAGHRSKSAWKFNGVRYVKKTK